MAEQITSKFLFRSDWTLAARGGAHMKLHADGTANRRIMNIEPQNFEGWFRCAQSFYKIVRIHSFDIHDSIFDIRFFKVSFSFNLAAFQASGGAYMKLRQNGTVS